MNVILSRRLLLFSFILHLSLASYSQVPDPLPATYTTFKKLSSVKVFEPLVPIVNETDLLNSDVDKVRQQVQYLDGLGQTIQTVIRKASLATGSDGSSSLRHALDIVQASCFDEFGRNTKSYFPFVSTDNKGTFKTDPFLQHKNYFALNFPEESNIGPNSLNWGYSKVELENSPLARQKTVFAPGVARIGNAGYQGVKTFYELNTAFDEVKIWTVDFAEMSIPSTIASYSANELNKIISVDGDGLKSIAYIDKSGHTILQKTQQAEVSSLGVSHSGWLCTYYVYDLAGRLRTIIPSKAVEYLLQNSWILNSDVFGELCFSYAYDKKGRISVKKSPGIAPVYFVYDKKDRVVFSQDGNQRIANTWVTTVYDQFSRVVSVGRLTGYNGTRSALNDYLSTLSEDYDQSSSSQLAIVPNGAAYDGLSYYYYDDYSYAGAKSFFTGYSFPANNQGVSSQLTFNTRVNGLLTGSRVKILDGGSGFHISSYYYDEEGRLIQQLSDNIKGGQDVLTNQYNFAGLILATHYKHSISGGSFSEFPIVTKYTYDALGRMVGIAEDVFNNGFRNLVSFQYDNLGRVVKKVLAPGQDREEKLEYNYDLNGALKGMNGTYASHQSNNPGSEKLFGFQLNYGMPNAANTNVQDGVVNEQIWRTPSSAESKRYHFTYDKTGQLNQFNYGQRTSASASWSNSTADFSGSSAYDVNGNITQLNQKGVLFGETQARVIDNLSYTYQHGSSAWTNKLLGIADNATTGASNGILGDFKNGSTPTTNQYAYDGNGNLLKDENKLIRNSTASGILYNTYLDLVEEVKLEGKGVLKYLYNGEGTLLSKTFTPQGGAAVSEYNIGRFYYENNELIHILTNEGRIRVIQPSGTPGTAQYLIANLSLPNGKGGVYDYFLKDHLENVRVVFTEELEKQGSACSMENANTTVQQQEESLFGQITATGAIAPGNEVVASRWTTPGSWTTNTSSKVSKLSSSGQKTGPNVILKVMVGDLIGARTEYHYLQDPGSSTPGSLVAPVIAGIVNSLNAGIVTEGVKSSTSAIYNSLVADEALESMLSQQNVPSTNNNAPHAYLTIVFFDETFKPLPANLSSVRVHQSGDHLNPLTLVNHRAPGNGYAYVYLSNESAEPVYFDNLIVTHERGKVIEENHYYPFGMKIAALSSRKLGSSANGQLQNRFGYQGSYSEFDDRTKWNEFELRMYDAQIGRWLQGDPYDQFASPYVGMGNNPVSGVDPTGGWTPGYHGISWGTSDFLSRLINTGAGALAGGIINGAANGWDKNSILQGMAWGGGAGLGATFVPWEDVGGALAGAGKWVGAGFASNQWQHAGFMLAKSQANGAGRGSDWTVNPNPGNFIIADYDRLTNDNLLRIMRRTINFYTAGYLDVVGNMMVDHFKGNSGEDFSNSILDGHISSSPEYGVALKSTVLLIKERIKSLSGNLSKYGEIVDFLLPEFPKFNGLNINGLYTLIHGFQYGEITLQKYKYNKTKGTFKGQVNVRMMDDFGVDAGDVEKGLKAPNGQGIKAMWMLQHKRGFRPYKVVFNKTYNISF